MELEYATYIDHTLLKADATKENIVKLCKEAREYSFVAVCINPAWVKLASKELAGSTVSVCTVVGFPLGASTTEVKVFETENAIQNGANEIDMVINIGELQSENNEAIIQDIRSVVQAAKGRAIVKVIIETSLLTDKEKKTACELAILGGADFVKTSTGFSTGGATEEDVILMRSVVDKDLGVKASGGVKDLKDMKKMIHAGASRIGTSSGVKIIKESKS